MKYAADKLDVLRGGGDEGIATSTDLKRAGLLAMVLHGRHEAMLHIEPLKGTDCINRLTSSIVIALYQ